MKIEYTLKESEFHQAVKISVKNNKILLPIYLTMGSIFFVAGLLTGMYLLFFTPLVFGFLGFLGAQLWLMPYISKKHFTQNKAIASYTEVELTPEYVTHKNSQTISKFTWEEIHKWANTPDLYLIYISNQFFHIIPKRAVTEHDDFIALMSEKVGPAELT
ncbi:MAG: YcxB family protein [Pseudoalteromonas sp.]|uniref:YcxB family protein n=1 Tax=unclassified Pseudoalteromonas TaxID=194690 RepID=UPI003F985C30